MRVVRCHPFLISGLPQVKSGFMKSFLELTKERFSVREYLPKSVEEEKLAYVMECVRMAPSACNNQPWRFFVISDKEELERVVYANYNRPWIQSAPSVIVCCGDHATSWKRRADGVDHAPIDVAIATEHLCLAAAEQGLGTCWVCNFDVPGVAKTLGLPENLEPIALVPLGYAACAETPEKIRRETIVG